MTGNAQTYLQTTHIHINNLGAVPAGTKMGRLRNRELVQLEP